MLQHPQRSRLFFSTTSNKSILMALKSATTTITTWSLIPNTKNTSSKIPISCTSSKLLKNTHKMFTSSFFSKPISPISLPLSRAHGTIPRPVLFENPEQHEKESEEMKILRQKLEEYNIEGTSYKPGQRYGLICPQCGGGDSEEKSLSLFIGTDGNAVWNCFRAKCGWKGHIKGSTRSAPVSRDINIRSAVKSPKRVINETTLQLEPLCSELVNYFAERTISSETLRRNSVMQRRYGEQIVIAFTYRKDGVLVNCKYRDINKKFWQESNVEKVFYGLDDIKGESDIIIVEGEMDKLAMEEAGFRNCVSVPDGAPPSGEQCRKGFLCSG